MSRLLGSLVILAALGLQPALAQGATKKTIRVAFLAPQTGNAAATGLDMINGWKMWWAKYGDTVAGAKVETKYYDTSSDANTALTKARQAVEMDEVDMIVGPYLANEGLAVASFTVQEQVPLFLPTVSADDLTQRMRDPYVLRVAGWTSSQTTHPAGEWAYEQGHRTAVTIANAYAFGYENAGGFAHTFTDAGGTIVNQLWVPLGTADYSPYLSRIRETNPDVVFVEMVGADVRAFLDGWLTLGLKDNIPLIGNETLTDQSNIRRVRVEAATGITTFGHYAEGRDAEATREFVDAFAAAYSAYPSYPATASYVNAQWITAAIEALDGDISDKDAFVAAVRNVHLPETAFGPLYMDDYGNPVFNVYIRKTEPAPNPDYATVWNVVVDVIPEVSQFWKWTPEEFLANPVYSDSYQGY